MADESSLWRDRLELLRLLKLAPVPWRAALWTSFLLVSLVPAALAVAVGAVVSRVPPAFGDGLGSPSVNRLWSAVGLLVGLLALERVLSLVLEAVRLHVARELDGAIRSTALGAVDRDPALDCLETGEVQASLSLVKGANLGSAGAAAVAAAGVALRYVQTAAALLVIAWFSIPLALLLGAVVVALRHRWHIAFGALADGILQSAVELQKVTYTAELVTTPPAVKEVRIFGLVEWLVDRARGYWTSAVAVPFAVRARLRRSANIELAVLGGSYAVTFVLAMRAAAGGELALGLLAALLQAQFSAAQLIAPTIDDFSTGPGIAVLRAARAVEQRIPSHDVRVATPSRATQSASDLVFDAVGFTYPGATEPVLTHVDLHLPAGRSLALVGLNGAGKTTLVKLLAGLYQPTAGEIRVDGTPLRQLDPVEWRSQLATVFQDFVHYQFTARENIGVGGCFRADDDALGRAAASAGAAEVIEGLPQGWDTILSRERPGGVELSGGQWQRVALARTFLAVEMGASLLILDEPSASLDVRAEAELFDRFFDWTGGVTSLLISHRLSTVRRAERIAVLDGGAIVETGSHNDLMAHGGRYAELFAVQASRFGAGEWDGHDRRDGDNA